MEDTLMSIAKGFAIVVACLLGMLVLRGFGPAINAIGPDKANEVVSKMIYVQDPKRPGVCYSMYATATAVSFYSNTVQITYIPCERLEAFNTRHEEQKPAQ
jgi:hypothetical protein